MSMSHRKSAMENKIDPSNGYCSADGVFYSLRKLEANVPVEMKGGATEFVLKRPRREGSVALVEAATGDEITYGELRKSVGAVAAGLRRLGVGKGDVVLVVSRNFLHFPALALAVMSTGALLSTANPLNNSLEIQKQMDDSNPLLVFTTTDQLHKFEGTVTRIVIIGPEGEYSGHLSLSGLFSQKPGGKRDVSISATDAAVVMYSSGTTGKSKGVVCTHRNLMAMTASLSSVIESPLDVYLCFIPLFHIYGFVILCGVLAVGGTVVISSNFTVESMLMATDKYRVSHISTVPTVITRLCKSPGVGRRYDLSCLKQVLVGGAAMGKEQMDTFKTLFPTIGILQVYGLTETTGATIWSKGDDSRHYGSAGILLPNLEAKIVDVHNGNPLPPNTKGELCLRGHVVMQGYYNNNKATSSVIDSQGWFHTGDICYINHRGRVYVVDRIKELIKYKGQQVAPAELEELLLCNSKIEDAAVIPYPNEDAGEIPMALIVKKHGSNITAQDAIDFVTTKVAPYKKIRRVAFVESIPRSPSGKILRKHLKTQILHQNVISRL